MLVFYTFFSSLLVLFVFILFLFLKRQTGKQLQRTERQNGTKLARVCVCRYSKESNRYSSHDLPKKQHQEHTHTHTYHYRGSDNKYYDIWKSFMLLFQQFIHSCQMPVDHVEEEEEEATEGEEAEERTIENRKSKSQFVVALKRGRERGATTSPLPSLPSSLSLESISEMCRCCSSSSSSTHSCCCSLVLLPTDVIRVKDETNRNGLFYPNRIPCKAGPMLVL